jgi:hypothetical protein
MAIFLLIAIPSARAQLLFGVEYTYGGEGPDRSGLIMSAGIPVYKGDREYDILIWVGRRFTQEEEPAIGGPGIEYNSEHQTFFGISPVIRFPELGLGIAPKFGYSSQLYRTTWDIECHCGSLWSNQQFFYGLDLQYTITKELILMSGYSPLNGLGIGAQIMIPLPSLKKELPPK